jgi:DNA-binding transcriptional regulator YiaG
MQKKTAKLLAPGRPSGAQVREIRERQMVDGRSMYRAEFAELIHATEQQVKTWEQEVRGVKMPAPIWLLTRITFDPLRRAHWIKELQKG